MFAVDSDAQSIIIHIETVSLEKIDIEMQWIYGNGNENNFIGWKKLLNVDGLQSNQIDQCDSINR